MISLKLDFHHMLKALGSTVISMTHKGRLKQVSDAQGVLVVASHHWSIRAEQGETFQGHERMLILRAILGGEV